MSIGEESFDRTNGVHDQQKIEETLVQLREWLEATAAEAPRLLQAESPAEVEEIGFLRILEEFTALRQELKLQTRGGRQLQENLDAAMAGLTESASLMRDAANAASAAEPPQKSFVVALVDLDEAMSRAAEEVDRLRDAAKSSLEGAVERIEAAYSLLPGFRRWFAKPYHQAVTAELRRSAGGDARLDAFVEGFVLLRDRLRRVLEGADLAPVPCEPGSPVDPHTMRVVDAIADDARPAGSVVQIIRRGYTWRGKLLRTADVRASRGSA